jgi:hypothetical protein
VTLAGTVVDQTPAIASNAVKSGYDAAQRVAAALAAGATGERARATGDRARRDPANLSLNGAAS